MTLTRHLRGLGAALLMVLGATGASADPLARALVVERARPVPPPIPREAFLTEPSVASVTLSPDGRAVAFVRIDGDRRSLWLQPTSAGAAPRRLLPRVGADQVAWSPDSRWLFLFDTREVRMLSLAGEPGSGVIVRLGGATAQTLLALDPWRPAALTVDRTGDRWRLWRVGRGGGRRLVAFGRRQIVDAAIDARGRPAFVKLAAGDRYLILARTPAGRFRTVAICARMTRCDLLGLRADGDAWLASDLEGDRRALLRLDRDGHRTLPHADPAHQADLGAVTLDRASGMPVLASYGGGRPTTYGLTPAARAGMARLARSGTVTIETSPRGWLVREQDARLQGSRWQLFDPATGRRRPLLDDRPRRLPMSALARVLPLTYRASDGMALHGLLTVPAGRDPARVPLVTLVHGGPWSHDDIGYVALVQLLANRGYAVFQPQFRGSTGYGRAYMLAARGDFGDGRVQRDIEEGTRYLLARGIGDPRRTAIMGASFGGYATLQALSNASRLYRLGIAIVPPTDFGWIIRWAATRTELGAGEGIAFARTLKLLNMDPADRVTVRRLSAQSPRARVAAMRTPLLLIAAGRDERVPIRGVIDYAARLRVLGAPASIVVAREQTHAGKDRMAALASGFLVETALARHLGGARPAPLSVAIRTWMATHFKTI